MFLVWIARICKPESFRVFYSLLVSYAIAYCDFLKQEYEEDSKCKDLYSWRNFVQKHKKISNDLEEEIEVEERESCIRGFKLNV